jgi:hypothetical protein
MDERAFGALARDNIHSLATPFKGGFAGRQQEVALRLLSGMTFVTIVSQYRFDVAGKIDLHLRRWWQLVGVYRCGGEGVSVASQQPAPKKPADKAKKWGQKDSLCFF